MRWESPSCRWANLATVWDWDEQGFTPVCP
jgi:hypothetical protein